MQATLSPNRCCNVTRLGNSRTHGWQKVDQTSSTTIFPLDCSRRFCVWSQLRISTLGAAVVAKTASFGSGLGLETGGSFDEKQPPIATSAKAASRIRNVICQFVIVSTPLPG